MATTVYEKAGKTLKTLDEAKELLLGVGTAGGNGPAGDRYLFVTESGSVIRAVFLTKLGQHEAVDVLFGDIDDQTRVGAGDASVGSYLPLSEIVHWQVDPRSKVLPPLRLYFYGTGDDQVVRGSLHYEDQHTHGRTVAEVIERLCSQHFVNPPDCSCEHIHCSSATCRSIVPSFGALTESQRVFPATADITA